MFELKDSELHDWVINCDKALRWFIETIGISEWERRRKAVITYLLSVESGLNPQTSQDDNKMERKFRPVAIYNDWMAWYMYLIECRIERPVCTDPIQSARIYSFFATIGRGVHLLKSIQGINERLKNLLNQKQNNPDSTLFELIIALCYAKNGWMVKFTDEKGSDKNPDFEVRRGDKTYQIECKRLAKVNEYSEQERQSWLKRWLYLAEKITEIAKPVYIEVSFKVPIEDVPEKEVGDLYFKSVSQNALDGTERNITHDLFEIKVSIIDLERVSRYLLENFVRMSSPELIRVFTGEYDPYGNYTQLINIQQMDEVGQDDGLHALNKFLRGVYFGAVAKWECNSERSLSGKAKDIKKMLSKAVKQIPDDMDGIIHIGYETVNGPFVEIKRSEKIVEIVRSFNFHPKKIKGLVCHAFQPLIMIDSWEFAETVMYFGVEMPNILPEMLALDITGVSRKNSTHWDEDIAAMRSRKGGT